MERSPAWPEAHACNTGADARLLMVLTGLALALGLGFAGLILHRLGPPAAGWTRDNILRAPLRALVAENGMLTCALIIFGPYWLGMAYCAWLARRWRGTEVHVTREGIMLATPWQQRFIPWSEVSDVPGDFWAFSVVTQEGDRTRVPLFGLGLCREWPAADRHIRATDALQWVARAYVHATQQGADDPLTAPPELELSGLTYDWLLLHVFAGQLAVLLLIAPIFEPPDEAWEWGVVVAVPLGILILYALERRETRRQAAVYLRADSSGLEFRDGQRLRLIPWQQVNDVTLDYAGRAVARVGDERLRLPTGEPRAATLSLLARATDCSAEALLLAACSHYTSTEAQAD